MKEYEEELEADLEQKEKDYKELQREMSIVEKKVEELQKEIVNKERYSDRDRVLIFAALPPEFP